MFTTLNGTVFICELPFIFYFVWFVFLVCVYYVYLYMGQVPELKLMMMMMIVGFSTWRHTFKMAAITSFYPVKFRHLVSAHDASAQRICSSDCQFLIRSTRTFVCVSYNDSVTMNYWLFL